MSMEQLKGEADRTQKLVDEWMTLQVALKKDPKNKGSLNQKNNLHRAIQDMRALFQERALAFASLLAETP